MAEVSWDSDCGPTYNPLLTLREKRVLVNPRCHGKKSKAEKKAFRMEERKRWDTMLAEDEKKEDVENMQARQQAERWAMDRRHEREMMELTKQHESWDGEFHTSPLFYIKREQEKEAIRMGQERETIRREHEMEQIRRKQEMERRREQARQQDILNDNSWDTKCDISPLDYIRQGMRNVKF